MKKFLGILTGLFFLAAAAPNIRAANVAFGTTGNEFSIEFVEIGDAGNADDTTGDPNPVGKVEYDYSISKHEISQAMIDAATASGLTGVTAGAHSGDRPAANISWFGAAKFVNWLNTSSGGFAAYKFDGIGDFQLWDAGDTLDYDASNPYRSLRATYWLPSADEWYKAAYYDPNTSTYYDYATGQDVGDPPAPVASGTAASTAVYGPQSGPADITGAGGLSPYGTMAQNGNVLEWEETALDLVNDSASEERGLRGGTWLNGEGNLRSSFRNHIGPTYLNVDVGFRVAAVSAVPEPSRTLLGLAGLCTVYLRRRRPAASP